MPHRAHLIRLSFMPFMTETHSTFSTTAKSKEYVSNTAKHQKSRRSDGRTSQEPSGPEIFWNALSLTRLLRSIRQAIRATSAQSPAPRLAIPTYATISQNQAQHGSIHISTKM